jgi:antitoxin component YwqK of YwqJK toxin-antitoxin module
MNFISLNTTFGAAFSLVLFICSCDTKVDNGTRTLYFEGTDKVFQSIEYKNGKKNGYAKEFYASGILKAKQFYINDLLNDSSVQYWSDGKVKSIQFYRNMKKHGTWKDYNKEGKLFKEINFKDDLFDSTSTEYTYRTGKIYKRVNFKKGVKDGLCEQYYSNGNPQSKTYFDEGRVCKGTEEWADNGKKIDNDFKINITEKNELLFKGKITYYIKPEHSRKDDKVYRIVVPGKGNKIGGVSPLSKSGDSYVLEYNLPPGGGVIMEDITIAVYRRTAMGNIFIKTKNIPIGNLHF